MDLFVPIDITSLRDSKYTFVIVDDYTRYTWAYSWHIKVIALNNF